MLFRSNFVVIGLFLVLASQLNAMALSEKDFRKIITLINGHSVSAEQSSAIAASLPKSATCKRLFGLPDAEELARPAKRKKVEDSDTNNENMPPQGAKSVVKNGDNYSYLSPKKSGPFGKDISNRKTSDMLRNRKDSIYIWTGVINHKDQYVDYQYRIDASNYRKMRLKEALLDVEIKIRSWIKQDKLLYKRTVYNGLAGDLSDRGRGHKTDVQSLQGLPAEYRAANSSRKLRWFDALQKRGFNARMSPIIDNVPEDFLKPFEVLVGHLFNTTAKASTVHGDEAAYELVQKYLASKTRKIPEDLKSVVEDLVKEEQNFMLGVEKEDDSFAVDLCL